MSPKTIVVEWKANGTYAYCLWDIKVHDVLGIVLQFLDVNLQVNGEQQQPGDVLRIHHGGEVKTYFGDGAFEPVVMTTDFNTTWFEFLHVPDNDGDAEEGDEARQNSSYRLSFATYRRHTLPPEIEAGVYNCSAPYTVPAELQCDGFHQCLAAEDEPDNCNYTDLGCDEGWIAGGTLCLKFVIPDDPVSPAEAGKECRESHAADLGSLPHPGTQRLAVQIVQKIEGLIIGLERVKKVTHGLGHLYRFLWQWTQGGTVFGPQHPHPTETNQDCVIMTSEGLVKQVSCQRRARYGYVCSKINPKRMPLSLRRSVKLKPPTRNQDRLPPKQCPDGHFVHSFQPCSHVDDVILCKNSNSSLSGLPTPASQLQVDLDGFGASLVAKLNGRAYSCREMFDPADHLHVRYLDLSGSFQPDLENVHYMGYLHFLNLSSCAEFLGTAGYRDLIVGLERVKTHVAGLSHLYRFLWQWTQGGTAFDGPEPEIQQEMFDPADHLHVRYLDLSGSFQPDLETVHYMGYLHFLNLSSCGLNRLALSLLIHLKVLDVSHNNLVTLSLGHSDLPALEILKLSACARFAGYRQPSHVLRLLFIGFHNECDKSGLQNAG
nr:hypothetical protein BaRGS_016075 [Batillaria attramentaria]